ncbi:MAG: glycosyltransferase 87 family protein, partial [Chloroflexota bacterium]|nr:glycosyltransferase 87 family protein [Chloroflexota bacterium]
MSRSVRLTWQSGVVALGTRFGPAHHRAARHALTVVGALAVPYIIVINQARSVLGFDAYAYWAIDLADLYGRSFQNTSGFGAFRYTPAIGQAFSVFGALPWEVFFVGWFVAMVATLFWMTGRNAVLLVAFPPLALELYHGNVHLFMAAAIVLGFRWPATWAFVVLTKVTPGIGLVWFAVRREWAKLAVALGATVVVSVVSYAVAPGLWREWLDALLVNAGQSQGFSVPPPLAIRLPVAAALVAWGAATDRPWTVGVAAMLALPILW